VNVDYLLVFIGCGYVHSERLYICSPMHVMPVDIHVVIRENLNRELFVLIVIQFGRIRSLQRADHSNILTWHQVFSLQVKLSMKMCLYFLLQLIDALQVKFVILG
jgi:hypothetical protein